MNQPLVNSPKPAQLAESRRDISKLHTEAYITLQNIELAWGVDHPLAAAARDAYNAAIRLEVALCKTPEYQNS